MWKFVIFFSIFVLLVIGVVYLVFHSPVFQIAGIEVVGSQKNEEIKSELISILSKTSKFQSWLGSENIIFWSPKAIKGIPQSLFWLSDLTLKRNWSSREIFIEVQERRPYLIWCQADSNCYWLDKTGVAFAFAPQSEGFIIPKVLAENSQPLKLGQLFFNNPDLVKNTLEIIKQLQNSSLVVSKFLIKDLNLQEMTAKTAGPELYFSLRYLPQNFSQILASLGNRVDFQKLNYIDFRVVNRIYYK
jgi:cell division septal protein FtsQ